MRIEMLDQPNETTADQGTAPPPLPRREPKRNESAMMALCGMVVVGAIAIGFVYWYTSREAGIDSSAAQNTVNTFLKGGAKELAEMTKAMGEAERVARMFEAVPGQGQVPLDDLKTDPFVHQSIAPVQASIKPDASNRQREREREQAIKDARGLKLQSILYSPTQASCIVDGRFVRVGDTIDGFELLAIERDAIVISRGQDKFRVTLNR